MTKIGSSKKAGKSWRKKKKWYGNGPSKEIKTDKIPFTKNESKVKKEEREENMR